MGLLIILLIVVVILICKSSSETSSRPNATSTPVREQTPAPKKSVPPTGRVMNWDNTSDICFALGAFIAGLHAGGWIGAYENGTLGFDIRNFSTTFNSIHERVPSDVIDFLAKNPYILKKKQVGEHTLLEIEFSKSFTIASPRTKENIERAALNTLQTVQTNLLEGANKTIEITGAGKPLTFRIDAPEYTASKTLWINMN